MNYNSIIILKDNLVYLKNANQEFTFSLNKEVLKDSKIINADSFVKKYYQLLKDNKISTFFWNKKIAIIYDSLISQNDLKVIRNVFTELNYREIKLLSDSSLIKLNKQDNYLLIGNIYKLYYIDDVNIKRILQLNKEILSNKEMYKLIKARTNNKNLFIVGGSIKDDLINSINYYIYDSYLAFFFNLVNGDK